MEPRTDTALIDRLDAIEHTCAHGETQNGLFGLFYLWMPASMRILAAIAWQPVTICMFIFSIVCYIGVVMAMKSGISNFREISQVLKEIETHHAFPYYPNK